MGPEITQLVMFWLLYIQQSLDMQQSETHMVLQTAFRNIYENGQYNIQITMPID